MGKLKEIWNSPITWGDSFKAAGVSMIVSAIAVGIMMLYWWFEERIKKVGETEDKKVETEGKYIVV